MMVHCIVESANAKWYEVCWYIALLIQPMQDGMRHDGTLIVESANIDAEEVRGID